MNVSIFLIRQVMSKNMTMNNRIRYGIGLLGALFPSCIILFFTVSHELTINWGYNQILAQQYSSGLLPYRDIPMWAPPLNVLIIKYVSKFLGDSLSVYIIMGIVSKILICVLLYHLLSLKYNLIVSSVSSAVGGIVFATWWFNCNWFSWNEIGFAVGFITAIILVHIINNIEKNNFFFLFFLTGILCGISIVSKQTLGILTFFLVLCVIIFLFKVGVRVSISVKYAIASLLGCFLIFSCMAIWLYEQGILIEAWNSTTSSAIQGKGGLDTALLGHFRNIKNELFASIPFAIYCFISFLLFFMLGTGQTKKENLQLIFLVFSIPVVIICAYIYAQISSYENYYLFFKFRQICLVYGAFFQLLITIISLYYAILVIFRRHITKDIFNKCIVFGIIFLISYGMSMSQASSDLAYYNYALAIAWLLYKSYGSRIKTFIIIPFILICVFSSSTKKFSSSYFWYNWWGTPVSEAKYESNIPVLTGIKLGFEEKMAFEIIANIVNRFTKPDDPVFIFNNAQLFYLIADRKPYTKFATHHIDTTLDSYALEDAKKIQEAPPKIIIYLREPEYIQSFFEQAYRHGQPSGLREIDKAIVSMIERGIYREEALFVSELGANVQKSPHTYFLPNLARDFTLTVLVRSDLNPEYDERQRS